MQWSTFNPASGAPLRAYEAWPMQRLDSVLADAATASQAWTQAPMALRAELVRQAGGILRERRETLARLITLEMGKLIGESRAEVEKCAWACDYYADDGPGFLVDEPVQTDAGRSYVTYQPLGTVLAVMPWNFPLWQVFRAAIPTLLAGNTILLKHASNVTGCALAIEDIFLSAGFPASVFRTLLTPAEHIKTLLADPRVHAVTVTASERAGRDIAMNAGAHLKKAVLELGGSDAFLVLEDADLDWTVSQAVASRFQNAGQSCIAAKRMIVVDRIADRFLEGLKAEVDQLTPGLPLDETTTLAPLARPDLRQTLERQIGASLTAGAVAVTGCASLEGSGWYYAASILDRVGPGMAAFDEELFGPVAAVSRARDEAEAVKLANQSRFGLGGSVWTSDLERGERIARQLVCGASFVNGMVKSDPRLPFGGIKASGFGRELSRHGMREFVNVKTLWIK